MAPPKFHYQVFKDDVNHKKSDQLWAVCSGNPTQSYNQVMRLTDKHGAPLNSALIIWETVILPQEKQIPLSAYQNHSIKASLLYNLTIVF